MRRSTEPPVPKADRGWPVRASSAMRWPSHVPEKMVDSLCGRPDGDAAMRKVADMLAGKRVEPPGFFARFRIERDHLAGRRRHDQAVRPRASGRVWNPSTDCGGFGPIPPAYSPVCATQACGEPPHGCRRQVVHHRQSRRRVQRLTVRAAPQPTRMSRPRAPARR